MRLSNMADYAVVLMSATARHCGGSLTNAAALAEETGVSSASAHKLVHALVKAGLLKSVRGQGGGVRLARPAAAITLAQIIEAVEGPIAMTACVDSARHDCALEQQCRVQPHWAQVNATVRSALDGVSLASLTYVPFPARPELVDGRSFLSATATEKRNPSTSSGHTGF